ncbi:DUF1254 domain-containing protein [Phenylobacterium sp.]|uniref:DUF1254 domain-containing protein n=1 Tax=Phenylobacterium sp. TaxID=1871053 RepID=UPI0025DD9D91|nr:DUF1254 domain-containing protein [Phenylobacterium sp.]MBX3482969.1 DUF1254 domain-containing protein [Phenylobacterium sp.]
MRASLIGVIAFVAAGAATHAVLLFGSPTWATDYQIEQGIKRGGGWNGLIYGKPPRAGTTTVGLANPDTLGTRAYLDLSKGPLIVEGVRPESCAYWSLSVFAHDTDTVLVMSDRELPSGRLAVALRTADQAVAEPVQASAVLPSPKGVLLIRCFMKTRTDAAYVAGLAKEVRAVTMRPAKVAAS